MRSTVLALFLTVVVLIAWSAPAAAIDRNFAGSAQLDYHFVPTEKDANPNAGTATSTGPPAAFEGFTLEATLKLAVDLSKHLSGNVKVCYGCHGLEADMAYFDLRAVDELNLRVGRFSPSFGSFNLRHDVANHKLSDKPLPYDMGRMLRRADWNMSVLPSPFPDNGLEVNGTHWFGDTAQFDYAVYAVAGFRNTPNPGDPTVKDINFAQSHLPNYMVDNNARPTGGARLALTVKPGALSDISFGASGMGGYYDNENKLTYLILGGDFSVRVARTSFRMEYLVRRTQFDTTNATQFKYQLAPDQGDYFTKHGAYAELEQPLAADLDLIGRVDGMYRVGNVPAGSLLSWKATMYRETMGLAWAVERNLRLKTSVEFWEFGDPDANGHHDDVSFHLGFAGTF